MGCHCSVRFYWWLDLCLWSESAQRGRRGDCSAGMCVCVGGYEAQHAGAGTGRRLSCLPQGSYCDCRVTLAGRFRLPSPRRGLASGGVRARLRQCSRRSQTTDPYAARAGTCTDTPAACPPTSCGTRLERFRVDVHVPQDPRISLLGLVVQCLRTSLGACV